MPRRGGSIRKTRELTDFSELAEELYARPVARQLASQDTLLPKWELEALAAAGSSKRDSSERPVQFMPTEADLAYIKYDEAFNEFPRLKGGPFARELGLV